MNKNYIPNRIKNKLTEVFNDPAIIRNLENINKDNLQFIYDYMYDLDYSYWEIIPYFTEALLKVFPEALSSLKQLDDKDLYIINKKLPSIDYYNMSGFDPDTLNFTTTSEPSLFLEPDTYYRVDYKDDTTEQTQLQYHPISNPSKFSVIRVNTNGLLNYINDSGNIRFINNKVPI